MRHVIFLFSLFVWQIPLLCQPQEKILEEANKHYQLGENSQTYLERESAFNRALSLYLEFASLIAYPSGELNQAIANTFFQLNEYPWSILYNEKALQLQPRNLEILRNLSLARSKIGLKDNKEPFSMWQKILLNHLTSIGERFELFFWASVLSLIALTSALWYPNSFNKKISVFFLSISLLLLFNIMLAFYFSPIEGILISSTGYYREPDITQPQLTSLPKKAGAKMWIVSAHRNGSWLKVTDSEGLIGYIPAKTIRLIEVIP